MLLALIVRSRDITILVKRRDQQNKPEQRRVARGLCRSTTLEIFVFGPSSAGLLLLIAPLIIPNALQGCDVPQFAVYSILGIVSYGFPFATIKLVVTRVAKDSLKKFASIMNDIADDLDERPSKKGPDS